SSVFNCGTITKDATALVKATASNLVACSVTKSSAVPKNLIARCAIRSITASCSSLLLIKRPAKYSKLVPLNAPTDDVSIIKPGDGSVIKVGRTTNEMTNPTINAVLNL